MSKRILCEEHAKTFDREQCPVCSFIDLQERHDAMARSYQKLVVESDKPESISLAMERLQEENRKLRLQVFNQKQIITTLSECVGQLNSALEHFAEQSTREL
ncbi:MAG: hypothetical protein ABFC56_07575 [Clostridiaceae bacterium]